MARVLRGLIGCLELEEEKIGKDGEAGTMAKDIVGLEFSTSPNIGLLGLRRQQIITLHCYSGPRFLVLSSMPP